jgi:hypothetical protein
MTRMVAQMKELRNGSSREKSVLRSTAMSAKNAMTKMLLRVNVNCGLIFFSWKDGLF